MNNKRILVCSLYAPYPPYDGGTVRAFELLKSLGEHYHTTFLGTYNPETENARVRREHLLNFCERVELVPEQRDCSEWGRIGLLRDIFRSRPTRLTRFLSDSYSAAALELTKTADLIVSNTILTGQLFTYYKVNGRKVLDLFDRMELLRRRELRLTNGFGLTRVHRFVDWFKTARYERAIWSVFDGLIAISEVDARILRRVYKHKSIGVVPMGINMPPKPVLQDSPKSFDILMVAKLNYPPNSDALFFFDQAIMPRLCQRNPRIRVAIVGKNPTPILSQMLARRENYTLFADVADTAPYYQDTRMVVVPLRTGSGMKVKVLEALAWGLPVVTTSVGAEGINLRHGDHVLIADDPAEITNAISRILDNASLASQLGRLGRKWVEQNYDWRYVKKKYLNFIEQELDRLS